LRYPPVPTLTCSKHSSQFLASEFSSSKANGYFNLVPVIEELPGITLLEFIIMGIDHGAHPDFFECESRLLFLGLPELLAFLEFELL